MGYANSPFVTISNCLSIGKVQSARYAQFFGALNGSNSKILNSYYQGDNINGSGSGGTASPLEATKVTDGQLESGEVCYKLNGNQTEIAWYQTITEDSYPVLSPEHEQVFFNAEEGYYYNLIDDVIVGISKVNSQSSMVNGQSIYNLSGQRLDKMHKGVNIVSGKKIVLK